MARLLSCFFVIGFLISDLWAQSMEMPDMPDMPKMSGTSDFPQVSMPTMDGSFYRPSVPSANGKKTPQNTATETSLSNETILTDATTTDDLLSALLQDNSTLTAKDISSLYDSGLFTDLSSLNGTSLSSFSQGNTTNLLLRQVLTSLDQLKTEQNNVPVAQKEQQAAVTQDKQTFKTREPEILRFKINGYDIKSSLETIFFSDPEEDGTFLLTADRKYFADGKSRSETFYILFKTVKNTGSTLSYQVQPSIVQDYKNENSFIYKLTNLKNLTAEKTGNMVALRTSGDLNIDLLLNIAK